MGKTDPCQLFIKDSYQFEPNLITSLQTQNCFRHDVKKSLCCLATT